MGCENSNPWELCRCRNNPALTPGCTCGISLQPPDKTLDVYSKQNGIFWLFSPSLEKSTVDLSEPKSLPDPRAGLAPCTRRMKGLKGERGAGLLWGGWRGQGKVWANKKSFVHGQEKPKAAAGQVGLLPSPPAPADYPDGVMMIRGQELCFPLFTAADNILIIGKPNNPATETEGFLKIIFLFIFFVKFCTNIYLWMTQPERSAAKSKYVKSLLHLDFSRSQKHSLKS